MTKFIKIFLVFICASNFTIAVGQSGYLSGEQYIEKYSELAVREMKRVGIPASITLAQGMLESGNGNSTLARKSNNHFGIKCHDDWNGKRVYHDDDAKGECFRKYKNVYESFMDHSDFLTGKQRYASLFSLKSNDYKGWAKGLKKAGYATDPSYAKRLIKIIEENNLQRFDSGKIVVRNDRETHSNATSSGGTLPDSDKDTDNFTIDAFPTHKIGVNNGVKYITVQEGDSFEGIAEEFGLKDWEIYSYNDISKGADIDEYRYLYVQPKRNKAHRKHSTHRVKEGESMHYISQKYGVKLKRLYRLNNMNEGDKVSEGDIINLRRRKR